MSKSIAKKLYLQQQILYAENIKQFGRGIKTMCETTAFMGDNLQTFIDTLDTLRKCAEEYNAMYAKAHFIPEEPEVKSLKEHSAVRKNTIWDLDAINNLES